MGMKLSIKKRNNIPVVEIRGRMDGSDAITISRKLEKLSQKKYDTVVLDLSFIDFLDSHWIGTLVYSWKIFREVNKELVFCIPPGHIRELFATANLIGTFGTIETLDELQV